MVVPHGVFALPRSLTTTRPTTQRRTGVLVVGDSPEGLVTAAELAAAGVPITLISTGIPGQAPDRDVDDGLLVPQPETLPSTTATDASAPADSVPEGSPSPVSSPGPDSAADRAADSAAGRAAQDLVDADADGLRTAEACQQLAVEAARLPEWLERCHVRVRIEPADWPHWLRVTRRGHTLAADVGNRMLARLRITALDNPDRCRLLAQVTPVDLLTDADGRVCGVRVLSSDGQLVDWLASAVVLADGGLGPGWPEQSPSVSHCLAMALRAGAVLSDLEFLSRVELAVPPSELDLPDVPAIVLPDRASQADSEMDWSAWPRLTRLLHGYGLAADAGMARRPGWRLRSGGVVVDTDGRTTLPGLWAIGGCAAGGSLGGDPGPALALTQAFVDARRCAAGILTAGPQTATAPAERDRASAPVAEHVWRARVTSISQALAGPRDHTRLRTCLGELARSPWSGAITPRNLTATSQFTTAVAVLSAAVARPESRGPHRRADHPQAVPRWQGRHVQVRVDAAGALHVRVTPADTPH